MASVSNNSTAGNITTSHPVCTLCDTGHMRTPSLSGQGGRREPDQGTLPTLQVFFKLELASAYKLARTVVQKLKL